MIRKQTTLLGGLVLAGSATPAILTAISPQLGEAITQAGPGALIAVLVALVVAVSSLSAKLEAAIVAITEGSARHGELVARVGLLEQRQAPRPRPRAQARR